MVSDRCVRSTVQAGIAAVAAFIFGIGGAFGQALAADPAVSAIVVKWRDDVVPLQAPTLPAEQLTALSSALSMPFSLVDRTRDGAFRVELLTPVSLDEARAVVNRVRMLNSILYADLNFPPVAASSGASEAKAAVSQLPVRQLIIKYSDFSATFAAARNQPLSAARLSQLSAWAGQALTYWRAMSGGAHVIRLSVPLPPDQAQSLAQFLATTDPAIEYVEPDLIKRATLVPNDPLYSQQWNYQSPPTEPAGVNLPPAWDITTGSSSIFIGVIDTGILPHPDLAGRYVGGYDMISDPLVANDNDPPGCTTPGAGSCGRDPDPSDPGDWITPAENASGYFTGCGASDSSWHGTHVAGTIAAASNNATGVAGINWISQVVPVRVLGKCGGYDSDIVDAIVWAVGGAVPGVPTNPTPVRVINMSLGGGGPCGVFQNAINTALTAGAVVAVAAGNSNQDASNSSPGNCNGVITVAALGRNGGRASYSNFGPLVEIAAPGGAGFGDSNDVLSTLNDGLTSPDPSGYDYVYYAGTSMATPHVTGIASLMLSVKPALTPAQVLAMIQSTARPFPNLGGSGCSTSGTKSCGAGIIDATAALLAAQAKQQTTTGLRSSVNPSIVGTIVTFTATVTGSTPTGSVNFTADGSPLCSLVALSGGGNSPTAQCSTGSLTLLTHNIVASYVGDSGNATSTSPTLSQVVNPVPGSSLINASFEVPALGSGFQYNPGGAGIGWTFSANSGIQHNGSAWGAAAAPNGVQTAFVQSTSSIAQPLSLNAGNYTLTFMAAQRSCCLTPNTQPIEVTVDGAQVGGLITPASTSFSSFSVPFNIASSGVHTIAFVGTNPNSNSTFIDAVTLSAIVPGTALVSSPNPSNVGDTVTFTATVTGAAPTGSVTFVADGATTLCNAVGLSGGGNTPTAQCSSNSLSAATHSIVANYGGDINNPTTSSSPLSQIVNTVVPPAALVNPSFETPALGSGFQYNPSGAGIGWTFSASSGIQHNGSAWGAAAAPNGVQTAFVQSTGSISQALNLNAGNYTLAFQAAQRPCCLTPNTQPIKVSLDGIQIGNLVSPGSTSFGNVSIAFTVASSGTHTLAFTGTNPNSNSTFIDAVSLTAVVPGTTLASSLNPAKLNKSVSFTATVTGTNPTGTVAFTSNGSPISGCTAVGFSGGSGNVRTAQCVTSFAATGSFNIVANYSGNGGNAPTSSPALAQTVKAKGG